MFPRCSALSLLLALGAVRCTPASEPVTPDAAAPVVSSTANSPASSATAEPGAEPTAAVTPPTQEQVSMLAKGNNRFAFDLNARMASGNSNVAMSPASIRTALAMAWLGAKGTTASEMAGVLSFDSPPAKIADASRQWIQGLESHRQGAFTLRLANRLFGEKSFQFEAPYLEATKQAFGAPLEPVDWANATEPTREHVNKWVAQKTEDRIKDLIPSGGVSPLTRLVLVNAIYFLGDWQEPFKKEATTPVPFYTTPTSSKPTPTMHQVERFRFASQGGVRVLELPYVGGEMAMTLLLPDAKDGLPSLEKSLTTAKFDALVASAKPQRVDVALPKFRIQPPSIGLASVLGQMGMKDAFSPAKADFTGMANPKSAADRLSISDVFHKAFVQVDEKGTEAAAATAVVMVGRGAPMVQEPPAEFHADHPFLFFIRDVKSGMILFMGRVADPTA